MTLQELGAFIDAHPYVTFGVFLVLLHLVNAPARWFSVTARRRKNEGVS